MMKSIIYFLHMFWEKIISKSVFVYGITVDQYFNTICERGDKSPLPKRRLLLRGQGTGFG
ncbi:hypothetical protein AUK10_02970 [Candidatus Gracilibacteria bacterium CG2_30_37_12]|nr:MAG: hypothetical protein AUK10_02970 [Candidatus Gracilibacteria bacterium CG2_30_37_12]